MRRRSAISVLALALAASSPGTVRADFPANIPDHVQILIGGTAATFSTGAALGRNSGALSKMVSFEDFFDVPINSQFARIEGSWRFGERHYVDVGYVNIDRSGSRQIDSDFTFGDYTFHAGAQVEGGFASRFLYAAYRYDFLHEDRVRISGSAGISAERLEARVSSQAGVTDPNGQTVTGGGSQEGHLSLPVPLLGLQLDWALHPRFVLQTHTRMFSINYSGIRGSQTDNAVRLLWCFHRNASLGVGYDEVSLNLPQFRTGDQTLRFAYDISGLSIYLRGQF